MIDEYGAFGVIRISRGNRSSRKKNCPNATVHHKSLMTSPGLELGPQRWEAGD
jgi:hypothetical protein